MSKIYIKINSNGVVEGITQQQSDGYTYIDMPKHKYLSELDTEQLINCINAGGVWVYDKTKNLIKQKLYLTLTQDNIIISISSEPDNISVETPLFFEDLLDDDNITDGLHKYIDGKIIKLDKIERDIVPEVILQEYRNRRDNECFPIINRGNLWYDNLTETQKSELSEWYNAWLNVTETLIVPDKPEWLR